MIERNDGGIRCSEVLEVLSDHLDGDLDAPTVAKLELHLQACPNCARFGRSFGGLVAALPSLGQVPESARVDEEDLLARIRQLVED